MAFKSGGGLCSDMVRKFGCSDADSDSGRGIPAGQSDFADSRCIGDEGVGWF